MSITTLLVFLIGLTYSAATLTVEVKLISYHNPTSEDCNGGNCEGTSIGICDNVFYFCLRAVGNTSCIASVIMDDIQDDSITFSSYDLSQLRISNPLRFSRISTTSLLELYVYIVDYDAFSLNDPVDEITIPLSKADGEFSPSMTYYGVCERASLTVQFRITSECPSNQYGPQCTKECVGVQRITFCNYIGDTIDLCPYGADCVCEGNFLEPNCIICDENYYPPDLCNVQCIPQDNSFGHYTCDPESGDRVCLEGYTDPLTFCVEENEDAGSGATTGATTAVSVILIIIACCALCCCAGCYSYCKQLETDVATTTPSVINTTRPVATSATMPKIVIQDPTKPFTLTNTHPVVTTTNIQASNKPIKLTTTRPVETTTTSKPIKLTATPPVKTPTAKPIKLTTTRPVETTTTSKPIKPTATPPIETTTSKPIKLTIIRPIQTKRVDLTLTPPVETATSTKPIKLTFIRPIETTTTKNLIQEPTKSVKLTLTRPVKTSGTTTKKTIKPTTTPPVETTKNLIHKPTKPVDPTKQPIPQGITSPFVHDGKIFVIVTKPQ